MKVYRLCLIGYGKWGNIIAKNFSRYKNFNLTVFTKSGKKNTKKLINYNQLLNFDLLYAATNKNINTKLSKYALLNNINIISEKPVFHNLKNINEFRIKKFKCFFKVNYIYKIFNNYLKIKKKIRGGKIKKIFILFGSNSKKNSFSYCKWEWLPHIFSLLDYYSNINIKSIKVKKKFNNYLINIRLKNNVVLNCLYGNNFKKKIRYQKVYYGNKKFLKLINNNLLNSKRQNIIKITPIETLINLLVSLLKKNKMDIKDLNDTISYNKYIRKINL